MDDRMIADFDSDGAICLRGVFSQRWLDLARRGIEENMRRPGPGSESLTSGNPGCGAYFNDYCNWRNIEELREYVLHSPAKEIAGRLMQSKVRTQAVAQAGWVPLLGTRLPLERPQLHTTSKSFIDNFLR